MPMFSQMFSLQPDKRNPYQVDVNYKKVYLQQLMNVISHKASTMVCLPVDAQLLKFFF